MLMATSTLNKYQPQQKMKSTAIIINKGNHNDNKRQLQQKMKGNCSK